MNLDELLATKNPTIIKKALSNYSIHPIEPFYKLLQSKNWRALFEYAVDNGNNTIANAAISNDVMSIEKELISLYLKSIGYTGYPFVNGKELKLRGSNPITQNGITLWATETCLQDMG